MSRCFVIVAATGALVACSQPPAPGTHPPASHTIRLTGALIEKLDGPPYSYLHLQTEAGDVWAVVPIVQLDERAKKRPITVANGVKLKRFDAPQLGRKFDEVLFGTLE